MNFIIKKMLSSSDTIYDIFEKRLKENSGLYVSGNSKFVLDGFPRSANSFALQYFLIQQNGLLTLDDIAHHRHNASQYKKANKLGIPTLILIRNPRDACLSFVTRHPSIKVWESLYYYLLFYRPLLDNQKYSNIEVLDFDQVIKGNFELSINRLNQKFSANFSTKRLSESEILQIKEIIKKNNKEKFGGNNLAISLPNEDKIRYRTSLEKRLSNSKEELLLTKAKELYNSIHNRYMIL